MAQSPLVSSSWLTRHIHDTDIRILDASWHLDKSRNPVAEFASAHIENAVFFDIDTVAAPGTQQPHTLPSQDGFSRAATALGLSNTDTLIVYDNSANRSAARAWWMFRAMGHDRVFVLDGGFGKWQDDGHPVHGVSAQARPQLAMLEKNSSYQAAYKSVLLNTKESLLAALSASATGIIDARSKGRFMGTSPEPRSGLRSGHMPGARNLPFNQLYAADETMLQPEQLRALFDQADIDINIPQITTCGSGITSCCIALAFAVMGKWDTSVYDGSWSEWGADASLPIEV